MRFLTLFIALFAATLHADDSVQLVAPGVISTAAGEYSPTYDAARKELVFMRRTPGQMDYTLYSSVLKDGQWTTPAILPFSGRYRDAGPSFSADGEVLVYDSKRPADVVTAGSINLWRVRRQSAGWSEPELLQAASRNDADEPVPGQDEFGPVTVDGESVWFYSFRKPKRGGEFYKLDGDNRLIELADIPDPSASTFVAYFTVSDDEQLLILEGRSLDSSDSDLFFSCRNAAGWSEAVPLDALNSDAGEGGPYLSSASGQLFFVSDRETGDPGASDTSLYVVDVDSLGIPCAASDQTVDRGRTH